MVAGGVAALTAAGCHFFWPSRIDLVETPPAEANLLRLSIYAVGLLLTGVGLLSIYLGRRLRQGDSGAWLFGVIIGLVWAVRAGLEVAYPVSVPLLFLDHPSPIILASSMLLSGIYLVPLLGFKSLILDPPVLSVPVAASLRDSDLLASIHFADAYQMTTTAEMTVADFALAIFGSPPKWAAVALRLRDRIAGTLFRLKTAPRGWSIGQPGTSLDAGGKVGPFHVFLHQPDQLILGMDDRHLDFRVVIDRHPADGGHRFTLTTLVCFNNWLGRAYFVPVRPVHRRLVPSAMRNAVK